MAMHLNADGSLVPGPPSSTPISRSITTPVVPASTLLMPANSNRSIWFVQAPQTAGLWINPLGGAAAPNAIDCFYIAAGGSMGSSNGFVTTAAISFYCATGNLVLPAFEA